jgi:glycerophosphoryl diester phosphodiesterase
MRVARVNKGLWQMTYDETRQLDVGGWFSPEFKGEKIPTLEEVIDLTRGKIKMIIELKYNGHDRLLPERTVEIIRKKGFEDQCVISSLNYEGLQKVKQLNNRLRTIYILFGQMGDVAKLAADGFGLQAAQVTPGFINSVHERGKLVYAWTVDDPREMEDFIEMDVDYIYTNDPAELIRLLERRAARTPAEKLKIKFQRLLDSISTDAGL